MTIYIALLRGINVGGKNIIKMSELKLVLEAMGLSEVKTYIQSGNVLFKSNEEEEMLRKKIQLEIEKAFKLSVPVIIRTAGELEEVISSCPFSEEMVLKAEASSVGESLYVAFLAEEPLLENVQRLGVYKSDSEECLIEGRDIFLLFNDSVRNSKLASNLQKLEVPATVRNWKTINKLAVLARAMEVS
jgi:uncharacterized protein (DUF1697 family)